MGLVVACAEDTHQTGELRLAHPETAHGGDDGREEGRPGLFSKSRGRSAMAMALPM